MRDEEFTQTSEGDKNMDEAGYEVYKGRKKTKKDKRGQDDGDELYGYCTYYTLLFSS